MAPGLDNMLPFSAFEKLNKNEIYHLCEIYQANQRKDQIIHNYLKTINEKMEHRTDDTQTRGDVQPNIFTNPTTNPGNISQEKVRKFNNFFLKETQTNLVLGSSIIANLRKDKSIPQDVAIHGYRGSTTDEKLAILEKYPDRKLRTVVLQDGTNSILKRKTSEVAELFDKYIELVKSVQRKFQPEYLVLCEVLPMRDNDRNRDQNERIKEFNNLLSSFFQSNDLNVTIKHLPVAELLLKVPNYNNLFYDDIHMNYRIGLPFLKNLLLSALLVTSNGLPLVESQQAFFPRYQQRQYNNSWANTWYPKQTYNYVDGFNRRF